ncbi:MAG: serine/threonine protein kinase [Polyangiaceae bacterium]|nr:serine/threonine protein kinase [Polyangiaceae bacterium]
MHALPTGEAAAKLGAYELVLELATHDTTVLLARRTGPRSFARWVSIRYVGPFMGDEASALERIDREVQRATSVQHPCVLPIHEAGSLANGRYIVSDYIEGATIAEVIDGRPVPAAIVVAIATDVLSGLEAISRAEDARGRPLGLVHGRVSPRSIVVGLDGRTRVADMGLSSVPRKQDNEEVGTQSFHYDAPEVLAGATPTVRSDVFATAMVLYEALAGRHPLARARRPDEARRMLATPLPLLSIASPSVPVDLAEVIARALSLDESVRYHSAESFSAAIERALAPASFREVGAFVAERAGARVDAKRQLSNEWVRAHAAALGEPTISTVARLRQRARLIAARRRKEMRALAVVALVLAGAAMGVVAWKLSF